MGKPKNAGYKRSWKNLLLNKGYQLRFTLFMVGISALLMAGLGWWVMRAAEKATTVAMDNVLGVECRKPDKTSTEPQVFIEEGVDEEPGPEEPGPEEPGLEEPAPEQPGLDSARERPRIVVEIEEQDVPPLPPKPVPTNQIARYHLCKLQQVHTIERLYHGEWRIFFVLIGSGILLCMGLAVYGIKMTHKVAGPLHKVKLYFAKMKNGRYDPVYNLRKGDQLVNFYAHFKEAHEGLRKVETEDVEMLRDLIAAADAANVADKSPEIAKALDELREVLAIKEEAIDG